ncbi:PTS fructose transporter subunit IIABC [Rothia kristinae]|uniref:PTS fructose transporter subunit IIABC n=1 Tax=Rothia kristinae TaxID=37923 RepID=UPI0021B513D5|nr:fructose-specific PTS transporter subunit EIIC [Rothia kristinae]
MPALITADLVSLDETLGDDRFDVIRHLAGLVAEAGRATSAQDLYADAKARESKTDTGIPGGIAIPHCRSAAVTEASLAVARLPEGRDFGAKDGPADLVFFIAAPDGADQEHLKLLSTLARSLMKKDFTAALRAASSREEIVDLVQGALDAPGRPAAAAAAPASPTRPAQAPAGMIAPVLVSLDQDLGSDRLDVIRELTRRVAADGRADDAEGLFADAKARESKTDTGIPGGIAIPHCRSAHVTRASLAMARPNPAVDFGAKDGPADLIFLIAAPEGADQEHLKLLSTLARSLMKKDFKAALREAETPEQIVEIVNRALGLDDAAAQQPTQDAAAQQASAAAGASAAGGAASPAGAEAADAEHRARLVAVTACPTGIAHTYMAADALKQAAEEKGVQLDVETQGSAGNEVLDQATIDAADAVIFAVSVDVRDRARFAGKPVVESPVKRGIDEPVAMIEEAEAAAKDPNARRVAGSREEGSSSSSGADASWGSRIYKSLMTGVSYMIPFVAAGGLMIALAFLMSSIAGHKSEVADLAPSILGIQDGALTDGGATLFNPGEHGLWMYLAAVIFVIGQQAIGLLVPALAGFIGYGMAGRPGIAPGFAAGLVANMVGAGFLGGIVGGLLAGVVAYALQQPKLPRWLAGMMPVVIIPLLATIVSSGLMFLVLGRPIAWVMTALNDFLVSMSGASALVLGLILGAMMGADLGGPINKTAYLFATAGLSAGTLVSQEIMGAVIAAGMATPLGMALATTLRKKYFTEAEINNGRAAWLLGASFISEGAIPFAAADPLRVIPSSIVGSAVTGAICMSTGVASQAPHGGIWILPVVSNPVMYLVAVIVGMLITAAMYLLLKRIGNTRSGAEKAKAAQVA